MKKISKYFSLICALVVAFTCSIFLTGCKDNNNPDTNSVLSILNSTIDAYEYFVYAPATATADLASELDESGDYSYDVGEFAFMNIEVLNQIQKVEENGEYLEIYSDEAYMMTRSAKNKYKSTIFSAWNDSLYVSDCCFEIKQAKDNFLELVKTDVEVVEEEGVEDTTISTYKFIFNKEDKFFRIESNVVSTDKDENINYTSSSLVECKIVGNIMYSQKIEESQYYDNGQIVDESKLVYEVKADFELVLNQETNLFDAKINSFVGCSIDDSTTTYSFENGVPANFATTDIVVEWDNE